MLTVFRAKKRLTDVINANRVSKLWILIAYKCPATNLAETAVEAEIKVAFHVMLDII
jgi:hypothetical protein